MEIGIGVEFPCDECIELFTCWRKYKGQAVDDSVYGGGGSRRAVALGNWRGALPHSKCEVEKNVVVAIKA